MSRGITTRRLENLLESAAADVPEKVGVIVGDRRWTYRELDEAANRLARALVASGLRRGDRVVLFLDNSAESVIGLFGVAKAGGVYSIVNSATKAAKLAFIFNNLKPRTVITRERLLSTVEAAMVDAPSVKQVLVTDLKQPSGPHLPFWPTVDAQPATSLGGVGIDLDLAYVIYTSGSTGFPKGVMMTHQSSISGASSIVQYLENRPDDVILSVIPMSFDYGMYQVIMSVLFRGTVILEPGFSFPNQIFRKIAAEGVTGFPIVPTTAAIIVNMKTLTPGAYPSIRYITSTAAPLPPAHSARLQELFPAARIFSNYGLTENIRGTYLPPEQLASRPTSVGKAMPNTEAYVVDESGVVVGPNTVGELVFRGGHLMRGYWENPEATDAMLKPGPYPWEKVMHTGDLFKTDGDGFLYYVGRKDDLLKTRGEKVPPKEVENALYQLAGVREAAIVGIPDKVQGMSIHAILALEEGCRLTAQEIQAHCAKYLEDYMVPSSVEFRAELPKTESGKIKRRELQDEVMKKAAEVS